MADQASGSGKHKLSHEEALKKAYEGGFLQREDGYLMVPSSLFVGKVDLKMVPLPPVDMFVEKDGIVKALRRADEAFSPLALTTYEHILIPPEDSNTLQKYAENQMVSSGDGQKRLPQEQRMKVLRESAINVTRKLFEDPSPEQIQKSRKIVSSFVYLLMKEPEAFLVLSQLSSHDPYTLQHSVGTAVNSIILARKIGMKDGTELEELGMAGLLHDIGKVKVKKEIINKEGPLNDIEWEEMQQHSEMGYDIVREVPGLSERTKRAVLEHHEDKNQSGYPNQIPYNDVDLWSKIVCISDVYNALTTNRSYSKAREPFEAFQLMRDKIIHKIDDDLFKQLVLIYGGKIEDLKTG